ncbi:MAG TPA: hypothetical protein DCM05_11590 [Elusimicrobia bacterium]|nr:hypothetical protein [Elusimicrobiota bacterium]
MLALLCAFLLSVSAAADEERWPTTITVRFVLHHEKSVLPKGYAAGLDAVHRALAKRLRDLSPWMDTEKIHIYLHASRESYLRSRYKPPATTYGLAVYPRKASEPRRLVISQDVKLDVVAHELSHLLFNSFMGEGKHRSPRWVDEGLATIAQVDNSAPGGAAVLRLRPFGPHPPMAQLMNSLPDYQQSQASVGEWYALVGSIVLFLKEGQPRSPQYFVRFCKALRDGQDQVEALRQIYGLNTPEALEKAWTAWRASAPAPKNVQKAPAGQSGEPEGEFIFKMPKEKKVREEGVQVDEGARAPLLR